MSPKTGHDIQVDQKIWPVLHLWYDSWAAYVFQKGQILSVITKNTEIDSYKNSGESFGFVTLSLEKYSSYGSESVS